MVSTFFDMVFLFLFHSLEYCSRVSVKIRGRVHVKQENEGRKEESCKLEVVCNSKNESEWIDQPQAAIAKETRTIQYERP